LGILFFQAVSGVKILKKMGETTTQFDLPDGRHEACGSPSKLRWELQSNHPHLPWFGKQLYQSRNWEITVDGSEIWRFHPPGMQDFRK